MIALILDEYDEQNNLSSINDFQQMFPESIQFKSISINVLHQVRIMADQLADLDWLIISASRLDNALERLDPILRLRCSGCQEIKIAVLPGNVGMSPALDQQKTKYSRYAVKLIAADLSDTTWINHSS